MTKFKVLGVAALALLTLARDATAQRGGGAVRTGARGAVVGGLVGGESGAATGAKIGVVTGAARSVGQEAQARAQYQATAAYQSAPRSDFNQAPPAVLGTAPPAATAPPTTTAAPAATTPRGEAVVQKNGKPVVAVTLPSDWKQALGANYISGVSADGQAYAMIATLDGVADKPAGIDKVKQGLLRYLQDIKYDDQTETKRGALVVTGTGKGKKSGVDVVFAVGVMDAGPGQIVGAAFILDSRIEDYYKETIRQICQTVRIGDDFAAKK
ncbi:hypothetical protein V5E97_34800 [Singulisphaera sp. Ch08]|uniref:Uncharacterized protein n=1 Tax=Singulisphaera sp. Ch08 TaxID=3120278 RepID=A0AAU7CET8_9BACT